MLLDRIKVAIADFNSIWDILKSNCTTAINNWQSAEKTVFEEKFNSSCKAIAQLESAFTLLSTTYLKAETKVKDVETANTKI